MHGDLLHSNIMHRCEVLNGCVVLNRFMASNGLSWDPLLPVVHDVQVTTELSWTGSELSGWLSVQQ